MRIPKKDDLLHMDIISFSQDFAQSPLVLSKSPISSCKSFPSQCVFSFMPFVTNRSPAFDLDILSLSSCSLRNVAKFSFLMGWTFLPYGSIPIETQIIGQNTGATILVVETLLLAYLSQTRCTSKMNTQLSDSKMS